MEDGLRECGEYPALLYHLARYESQAGRTHEAVAHLQRAIELRPDLQEHAEQDEDLKSVLAVAGES
jgi:tetratricopeptide (TPR) repeat protein